MTSVAVVLPGDREEGVTSLDHMLLATCGGTRILAATVCATACPGKIDASGFVFGRRGFGSGDLGQYLLLVFCVAVGTTSDFRQLDLSSLALVGFVALVMFGSVALHLLAAFVLRLDRDTVIITSTAAIFGPAFVGPVALSLRNREMMISGVASGLVGFAVGNYLGLGLAWALS